MGSRGEAPVWGLGDELDEVPEMLTTRVTGVFLRKIVNNVNNTQFSMLQNVLTSANIDKLKRPQRKK